MTSTSAADELASLAGRIARLATERGLTLIPATPTTNGPTVHLEPDDLSVEAFLDLAVTAEQHLVYLASDRFDADEFAELDAMAADAEADGDTCGQALALRAKAAQYAGRPISLVAAFVLQGVVHRWCVQAGWFDAFEEELAAFSASDEDPGQGLSEAEEKAMVDRLAAELITLPKFRAASSEQGRRRVAQIRYAAAEQDGTLDREYSRGVLWRATDRAIEQAMVAEQRLYADAEQRLPDLVQRITADPTFRAARTAQARKHRARDYLIAQAEGYAPPGRLLDLLVDALGTSRTTSHSTPMLPLPD
ncbi:hypothetical protein E1287_17155 [Actinomadura sp. KC06]|uniref:hypothetical protein n=1 Tax=Actinomadura sp. KC06 TaxID=2530369 RepID=UPI00104BA0A3|nr:hypothetical protein [Actinomadura sp. KC06]TDD34222.1 hypothetical protein E1287_17155 [Actinomadura sp. KC06]